MFDFITRQDVVDIGAAYLTTHKILWVDKDAKLSALIELKDIEKLDSQPGFFTASSPKILIFTLSNVDIQPLSHLSRKITLQQESWTCPVCQHENINTFKCFECGVARNADTFHKRSCPVCTFDNAITQTHCDMCGTLLMAAKKVQESACLKLSFRAGGMNEFLKTLQKLIAEKRWQEQQVPSPAKSSTSAIKSAGVSGILHQMNQTQLQAESNLSTAFADVNSLMSKISDMVKLAESIGAKISLLSSDTDSQDSMLSKEISEFRSSLAAFGITDPVTR